MGKPKVRLEDFNDMLNFEPEPGMVASAVATPSPESKSIMEMEFERMEPFPNHEFKLYEGQQLADMVESIREFGILIPIILWHREDDTYVILSGHNRCNAAKIAGFKKGPVIIKENLSCDEAVLIVTETNLRQRSFTDMSHSERAYCLAQHYEALKSQGKRSDLLTEIEGLMSPHDSGEGATSVQLEQKLESREKVGQEYGLSSSKVGRYIKISSLIEPLLMCVDTGEIAFLAAYDLAFVADTSIQQQIADLIQLGNYKVDMRKARLLRSCYEAGELTNPVIVQILSGEKTKKPKADKPQPFKIKPAIITKYFTAGQSGEEMETIIDKALALYFMQEGSTV